MRRIDPEDSPGRPESSPPLRASEITSGGTLLLHRDTKPVSFSGVLKGDFEPPDWNVGD